MLVKYWLCHIYIPMLLSTHFVWYVVIFQTEIFYAQRMHTHTKQTKICRSFFSLLFFASSLSSSSNFIYISLLNLRFLLFIIFFFYFTNVQSFTFHLTFLPPKLCFRFLFVTMSFLFIYHYLLIKAVTFQWILNCEVCMRVSGNMKPIFFVVVVVNLKFWQFVLRKVRFFVVVVVSFVIDFTSMENISQRLIHENVWVKWDEAQWLIAQYAIMLTENSWLKWKNRCKKNKCILVSDAIARKVTDLPLHGRIHVVALLYVALSLLEIFSFFFSFLHPFWPRHFVVFFSSFFHIQFEILHFVYSTVTSIVGESKKKIAIIIRRMDLVLQTDQKKWFSSDRCIFPAYFFSFI